MKCKKGAIMEIIGAIGLLVAFTIYFSLFGSKGPMDYENYLGEIQLKTLQASVEAEEEVFYIEESGKLSAYQAIYDMGLKGGYSENVESECGLVSEYSVWTDKVDKDCYPELGGSLPSDPTKNILTTSFFDYFDGFFDNYLDKHGEIVLNKEDFDCRLFKKDDYYIPIKCLATKDIKKDIVIKKDVIERGQALVVYSGEKYWPLAKYVVDVPTTGSRAFKANRDEGKRYHVGVDLVVPAGTPVIATEDGVVVNIYHFYHGTCALLIQTDSGYVINYGEVGTCKGGGGVIHGREYDIYVNIGDRVVAGQHIADVGLMSGGSHMVHFEMYTKGTIRSRAWYKGQDKPLNLLDPTNYLKQLKNELTEGSYIAYESPIPESEEEEITVPKIKTITSKVGIYSVRPNFKIDTNYNFNDYGEIIKIVKDCNNVEVEVTGTEASITNVPSLDSLRECVKDKLDFKWDLRENGNYFLFDVETNREVLVFSEDKYQVKPIIIKFAIEKKPIDDLLNYDILSMLVPGLPSGVTNIISALNL